MRWRNRRTSALLVIEMGLESTRNPAIAAIFNASRSLLHRQLRFKLFERARAEGRIAPTLDSATLAQVIATIGDGIFWRRAIDPDARSRPSDRRAARPRIDDCSTRFFRWPSTRPRPAIEGTGMKRKLALTLLATAALGVGVYAYAAGIVHMPAPAPQTPRAAEAGGRRRRRR